MIELYTSPTPNGWKDAVKERPAVQRGRAVPVPAEPSEENAEEVKKSGSKILV